MLLPTLASLLAISSLATASSNLYDISTTHEDNSPAAPAEAPTDGYVVSHLFPACNGRRMGGPKKPRAVPVDACLTTPGLGMVIKTAGVCANGTRAKWARFTDQRCGRGTIDPDLGLIDLEDSDLDTCLSTAYVKSGSEEDDRKKISSMAFWCDGTRVSRPEDDPKEPEQPKEKKGSVSESACMAGAPFFNHPKVDTCVNMRTDRMRIYSAGVCANGTQSTLAMYAQKGCADKPYAFMDITEEETKSCMDFAGTASFAFYCTGDIERSTPNNGVQNPSQGNNGGGALHFFLILGLICLMFFLMLVLSVLAWVRKYGGSVGKLIQLITGVFKPKDGGIAL